MPSAGSHTIQHPDQFLSVRVQKLSPPPPLSTLCAGYEGNLWRREALSDELFNWVPYVALNQAQQYEFGMSNFVEKLKIASAHIYSTRKTKSRGEIGEILLHMASVQYFDTLPILCKLVLKTGPNETIKGFDSVHVLNTQTKFEIWLGESKFYKNPKQAISEAISSIEQHISPYFLKYEKAMVTSHVNNNIPHEHNIRKIFSGKTATDDLIQSSVFPILIAYDSKSVKSFTDVTNEYVANLEAETLRLRKYFREKNANTHLNFQLIFVPIESKAKLIRSFDERLRPFL